MKRRQFLSFSCAAALAGTGSSGWAGSVLSHPVVIEAGRRVDAPDAQAARFPASNVPPVRERIRQFLAREQPSAIVASAACGTDLLLLDLAAKRKIAQYVLLGTDPGTFKKSSVVDRPGDWGDMFDQVMKTASVESLNVVEGQQGYRETNLKLLDRGQELARGKRVPALALVIWNLKSRGSDDVTEHFLLQARKRHIPVIEISTL